jgi:hypothetical protein
MPRPIAYKTGSIQPPNTAKQSNILIGVAPADWGVSVANTTFYNGVDSSYQYVIIKNSNPPLMWGTGDFTNTSLLTTINGLPDRVGSTPFTGATTAINWLLESGNYSLLKNEQPYGGPITNGLVLDFCPKVNNYFANGDFAYGTTIGWVGYGGSPFIYDITNDKPYAGSKSTKALANIGGGFTWGRYTSPIYGPGGLLVTGQTYTFSFWGKVISGPNFDINWNNQNGSGDVSSWTDGNYSVTTTWQKYTQTFTYNISKNFLYIAGSYAGNTQYVLTEFQLENGTTANAFSAFPVTAAGLTIPNNGLLNTSSFSLINGPYLNAINNGNINLDGVDDYVLLTDSTLKNYTTITANIWMYLNSYTSTFETYFSYNAEEAGLTQGWGIRRSGDAVFQYWGGTGNSGIKLYKNGSLVGSSNSTWAVVSGINTTGSWAMITLVATGVSSWNTHNRLTMGTRSDSLNTATNMNIGSFNLYNRELSAAEIENLYTAGLPTYLPSSSIMVNSGLVLYLDASNPNSYTSGSSTWNDISGYGNNGTLYNGVAYSSTYGGGLIFDGVDDYVVVPANATMNSYRPTVELVMTTSTNGGTIIAQGQYGSNWGFGVGVRTTNIMARNNAGDATISVSNSGLVHVVVVWDGSGNQYYKNGQYLGRTTNLYSPNPGGDVTIGGVRSQVPSQNLQEFANSTVNIVRVYNRALSATEILQNFNSIKTQYGL